MKIANITKIGKMPVYDLSVEDQEHYVLENGVVTHNTGIMYSADNVWIIGRQQAQSMMRLLIYLMMTLRFPIHSLQRINQYNDYWSRF